MCSLSYICNHAEESVCVIGNIKMGVSARDANTRWDCPFIITVVQIVNV
jgi:hypothetical protein